jgi:tetratricopeptide (TPR) repeat protein
MKTNRLSILFATALAAALLGLGAARESPLSPEEMMRRADAAFAGGDFARAAELYQHAADVAVDPGPATYNQAVATYRLALLSPDSSAGLREAAALFRCCLATDDPRRSQALFGLGNCLVHGPAEADGANLQRAIEYYRESLKGIDPSSPLAASARENLAVAELLHSQFVPPTSPSEDDSSADKDSPGRPERLPVTGAEEGGNEGGSETMEPGSTDPRENGTGMEKRGPSSNPGSATPPPSHDDQGSPRSPAEAAKRLEAIVQSILNDRRVNLLKSRPIVPDNVDDF